MNKKTNVFLTVLAFCLFAFGAGKTYSYFEGSTAVTSHISTGNVNISIQEYAVRNGKRVSYCNPQTILPGDMISKIPCITNKAQPCWIRAKISYASRSPGLEGFSEENLSGFPEEWVKRGDYFYYTKVLATGKSADLFGQVSVPEEWDNSHIGQELTLSIRADAIQAENFTPDFTAMSPWGNQKIQLHIHETDGKIVSKKKNIPLSVQFDKEAHRLLAAPDDFFTNFQAAMPGSSLQDSISLKNTTDHTARLLFRAETVQQDKKQQELLKKLKLTIKMKNQTLYTGNLLPAGPKQDISLGTFKPGESGQMDFTVSVPKELDNSYALRGADIKWVFTIQENEEVSPSPQPGESEDPVSQGHAATASSPVKTGDDTPILPYAALLIVLVSVIVVILIKARRADK